MPRRPRKGQLGKRRPGDRRRRLRRGTAASCAGNPRGLRELAARYLDWMEVRGYAASTVITTDTGLELFAVWCEERGVMAPPEVSRGMVERYQRHLFHFRQASGRALSFRTQRNRLICVKGLFKWLVREHYLLYSPAADLELPRDIKALPHPALTLAEVEGVLREPDVSTVLGVRDRALLEVFYATGMRRKELIGLEVWDADLDRGWVRIGEGKGGRERVVPLGDRALAWLRRYLEEVRPQLVVDAAEAAIFLTNEGKRFSPDGLTRKVREWLEAAGVEKRGSCHLFRHTAATLMLEGGADIRYIQEMLGHAKLETTQIYTRVSIQKLAAIHAATHPGAKLERRSAPEEDS